MRLLVTGARGFIGRHAVAAARARGWDVASMSRAAQPSSADEFAAGPGPWLREIFLAAIEAHRPDAILHIAGATGTQPLRVLFEANVLLTGELLVAVAALAAPPRIVLLGSAAEYGNVPENAQPAAETSACMPVSNYGISKYTQTLMGLAAASQGAQVLVARLFNPVGLGMPPHLALPSFARQLARPPGDVVRLKVGDIDVSRDFIDVEEAVRLLLDLAAMAAWPFPVVNICSGQAYLLSDLLDRLIAASGLAVHVETNPALLRPGDLRTLIGDTGRLAALGLAPRPLNIDLLLPALLSEARGR